MNYFRLALFVLFGFYWNLTVAQSSGEASEPSPEELDAAFTSEDAAREAAAFSDKIIDQSAVEPIQKITDDAILVFRGIVKSQSYVYDADGTPFTHTIFAIENVIKGDYPDQEITLIQQGGPSQRNADEILMVSTTLYFNVGEEELLFLDLDPGNKVASERTKVEKRFRIYKGKVYNEDGQGVIVESDGGEAGHRLMLSRDRHPSKRFSTIHIGSHTLKKNFGGGEQSDSAPPSNEKTTAQADDVVAAAQAAELVPSYADSVDVYTFIATIEK